MRRFLAALFVAGAGGALFGAPGATPPGGIDWAGFLSREDMVWSAPPSSWDNGPFIGNGNLGATIHVVNQGLNWEVNRTDVTHGGSRYPIGRVTLQLPGGFGAGDARLDLWNAEARGVLSTDRGEVQWRTFVSASPSVLVIELSNLRHEPGADVLWLPTLARPPRAAGRHEPYAAADLHPPPVLTSGVGEVTSTQTFVGGGAVAVVLRRMFSSVDRKVYVLAVNPGDNDQRALSEARLSVERAASQGFEALLASHRAWWHAYYPESFLSIPDPRLEAFYWIQIYKLGSAMRPDGPILDQMGPWYRPSAPSKPLPGWNQNEEMTYAPIFGANRLALGESLFGAVDRHRNEPINHLPWVMYLYWEYYRYQMDDNLLRNRVLPSLSRAIGNYLPSLTKGPDGRYHLPKSPSPELGNVPDASGDLAFLSWGLNTLITSTEHLRIADPRLAKWREVQANLTPIPVGRGGILVGANRPLNDSFRSASHLLEISPLRLLTPDRPGERSLIERSLRTWEGRQPHWRSFSYAGAASIHALLGEGDAALRDLDALLDRGFKPNTFAAESGPAMETPLAAATSLQDLLLQSWGGRLRVFPAMPPAWKEASFANLRGEGAFLVSGRWEGGAASWVKVESLAGGPCRVSVAGWTSAVVRMASGPLITVNRNAQNPNAPFNLNLPKGGWAVLAPTKNGPMPKLEPVPRPKTVTANPYPFIPLPPVKPAQPAAPPAKKPSPPAQ